VSISNVKNTELIEITITSQNNEEASKIANELAKVFSERIADFYDIQNVKVVDKAEVSYIPSNINKTKEPIIIMGIGVILALLTIFLVYYFDEKLRTVEEIESLTGLNIIGEIPEVKDKKKNKKKNKKKLFKRGRK